MPRGAGLVWRSVGGRLSAMTGASDGADANTWGTNTGTRAQQTHRAQFSGQGSVPEPRVSSTQSSGIMLASKSVLWPTKAASHTARRSRTTLPTIARECRTAAIRQAEDAYPWLRPGDRIESLYGGFRSAPRGRAAVHVTRRRRGAPRRCAPKARPAHW